MRLPESLAEAAWSILCDHAGANPSEGNQFLNSVRQHGLSEYRFCGSLGFGGKVRWSDWRNERDGCPIYVDCYPEDETAERRQAINSTNAALRMAWEGFNAARSAREEGRREGAGIAKDIGLEHFEGRIWGAAEAPMRPDRVGATLGEIARHVPADTPVIYCVFAQLWDRWLPLYVGQTTNAPARMHQHRHRRGIRQGIAAFKARDCRILVGVWLSCDCLIDHDEATAIRNLRPILNRDPPRNTHGHTCECRLIP